MAKRYFTADEMIGYLHAQGVFSREEFAEWLAEHDRKKFREGYETARQDMLSGAFVGGPTYEAVKGSFVGRKIQAEALRDAAYDATYLWSVKPAPGGWLRNRADRIERGD